MHFEFVIPTDGVLTCANALLTSDTQDFRDIAKVVIELTAIQKVIQREITNDGTVDLAPWFDYWFGDTIETALRLRDSANFSVCSVAQVLLDQEAGIIRSRESFLAEMKRLGIRPQYDDQDRT